MQSIARAEARDAPVEVDLSKLKPQEQIGVAGLRGSCTVVSEC